MGEFTGACSASSCSRSSRKPDGAVGTAAVKAWRVPEQVQSELENQLFPLLLDGHCGSVEFLYDRKGNRLYFDLNMLSTLPIDVADPDNCWLPEYDPWLDQAHSIWNIVL